MGVGVVIPVKDKLHLTQSIVEQCWSDPDVVEVVVVDNGSTDGTAEWLAETDSAFGITMPDAGIHEMWNAGVTHILNTFRVHEATSVAILNNDLALGDNCLSICDEALRHLPQLAAVCPNYDGRTGKPRSVVPTREICAGRYDGSGGLAGFAMILARDWAERYLFPESLRWWYGDNDLVLSIAEAGRQCGIVIDATCEHLDGGGQTGDWMSPEMRAIVENDRQVFLAKWAGK